MTFVPYVGEREPRNGSPLDMKVGFWNMYCPITMAKGIKNQQVILNYLVQIILANRLDFYCLN